MRAALLALFALGCASGGAPAASVESGEPGTAVVETGVFERRVLLTGELDARQSVDIAVPQTDTWQLTVSWIVEDGTEVKKGDRVVEFDNSSFTGNLEQQRMLVKSARRDYLNQRHLRNMSVADKENALAVAELERDKAALYASVDRDLISERDYQERQLALERAESAVLSAKADLESVRKAADLDLKIKRVASEKAERAVKTAEAGIAALSVTAPENGVAMVAIHPWMETKILAGDTLQPGWTVVRLPDLDGMVINARLSDVDDGRVTVGMKAQVIFDADPSRVMMGTVTEISAVARELDRSSLLRAFDVVVTLDEAGGEWARPGMSARVEVLSGKIENALIVPRAAVRFGDDGATVKLSSGQEVAVTVTECDAQRCAIASGLSEGASVEIGGGQ